MMKPLEMNEMLLSIALQRMGDVLQIQYVFLIISTAYILLYSLMYCGSSAGKIAEGATMGEERLKECTWQQRPH